MIAAVDEDSCDEDRVREGKFRVRGLGGVIIVAREIVDGVGCCPGFEL